MATGYPAAPETGPRAARSIRPEGSTDERTETQLRYAMVRAKWAAWGLAGFIALAGSGIIAAQGPFGGGPIEQPIAFPHNLHAGNDRIPCEYCHYSADRSVDAGMPALQVCAGCHLASGQPLFRRDSTRIAQLVQYWIEQRPIPWERVYKIADHAHFPHNRHIKGGVTCQECHGPVEEMEVIELNQELWMGWCVQCHRERQVRTDCSVCHY
jgi:hypothetical protein